MADDVRDFGATPGNVDMRSEKDVRAILQYAKIDPDEVSQLTQCVSFCESLDTGAVKLIELNDAMVDSLKAGERLIMRGEKSDSAVLCTDNKTYEVKLADTSNSMVLVPGVRLPNTFGDETGIECKQAQTVLHTYFELKPCKPRLKKLKHLLSENTFDGHECEQDEHHKGKKYTYEELQNLVQSSTQELKEGLRTLQACYLDNHVRLLDSDYQQRLLNNILQLVDENSWSLSKVPLDECCRNLNGIFPEIMVQHVLECYSNTERIDHEEGGVCYCLDENKICRFFGELLLGYTEKFNYEDFLDTWQQSVPPGLTPNLSQLEGLALIERESKPEVIRYFPLLELPEDVNDRFNFLFRTKERWQVEDITPFVRDCVPEKGSVSGLLAKHARMCVQKGVKTYTSKRPLL